MRAFSLMIGVAALAGLTACADDQLTNLNAGASSPDEFGILPTKPLSMPPDLALLPEPTPGGGNITDPTPISDAVVALGGSAGALEDRGVAASDQALVAYAGRSGTETDIRTRLAVEDAAWRHRNRRKALEALANKDVYARAYRGMALDPYEENLRWQRAGARTPSAPTGPVQRGE